METLRNNIINKEHLIYRREINYHINTNDSDIERIVSRFVQYCENEKPVILDNQQIVFMRTISNFPDCFTQEEWKEKRQVRAEARQVAKDEKMFDKIRKQL